MTLLNADVIVPELGQVVRCRDRVWAVNDVSRSSLPYDLIGGTAPQHLVRNHLGSGLDLPDHRQLVAETVVLERRHSHQVLGRGATD